MDKKFVLGIEIGGTFIRTGLVNRSFESFEFSKEKTSVLFEHKTIQDGLRFFIENYLNQHFLGQFPTAISVGFPSSVDKTRRIVMSTPNIKGLDNLPVADILEEAFNIPTFVNRDVNFLVLYDMYTNRLEHNSIVLGFYIGTGFGNAISINGKLLLGKNGAAAELGHIPAFGQNQPCGCGNRGCIEHYASGTYLIQLQQELFPDTDIKDMFLYHRETPELTTFVDYLSLPIATEINIFDPDYIIIGGGIPQMNCFPIDLLEQMVRRHTRKPYPEKNLNIRYSVPQPENGVIGAGIYGFKRLEDKEYR